MKAICDRAALLDSLNLVSGVVASRTPKPVLTCVKIVAEDAALTLSGTDMEVGIQLVSPRVDIEEAGEALVPAEKITQIVRESVDATLTLETDGDETHIRGEDSHFKVFGYPPGEFPPPPQFEGEADFELSTEELQNLISRTIFATARESSRYAINGVLLERDGNKLVVVATDGRRLALARGECKASQEAGDTATAIVPTKALTLVQRIFDTDEDDLVRVKIVDNQILFASDRALLASNLVEGNFPPYKDVIPKDGDKKATVAVDLLARAVRRAALLTNEETKGVRMAFNGEGLTLSSRAPEMGEAQINVELAGYEGDDVEIGFNPAFVLDALKIVHTDQVSIEMKASNKPGLIRTGPDFLYVIMPVNLQG